MSSFTMTVSQLTNPTSSSSSYWPRSRLSCGAYGIIAFSRKLLYGVEEKAERKSKNLASAKVPSRVTQNHLASCHEHTVRRTDGRVMKDWWRTRGKNGHLRGYPRDTQGFQVNEELDEGNKLYKALYPRTPITSQNPSLRREN